MRNDGDLRWLETVARREFGPLRLARAARSRSARRRFAQLRKREARASSPGWRFGSWTVWTVLAERGRRKSRSGFQACPPRVVVTSGRNRRANCQSLANRLIARNDSTSPAMLEKVFSPSCGPSRPAYLSRFSANSEVDRSDLCVTGERPGHQPSVLGDPTAAPEVHYEDPQPRFRGQATSDRSGPLASVVTRESVAHALSTHGGGLPVDEPRPLVSFEGVRTASRVKRRKPPPERRGSNVSCGPRRYSR